MTDEYTAPGLAEELSTVHYSYHCNLSRAQGMEEAAKMVMERAKSLFADGHSHAASIRTLAEEISGKANAIAVEGRKRQNECANDLVRLHGLLDEFKRP